MIRHEIKLDHVGRVVHTSECSHLNVWAVWPGCPKCREATE